MLGLPRILTMDRLLCLALLLVACAGSSLESKGTPRVFKKPSGSYKMFEGDIRVSRTFGPQKRKAVADKGLLWPYGVVPYTISSRFNSTYVRLIQSAMAMIEDAAAVDNKTCIQFMPRTKEINYVNIEMYRDCWADLGRLGVGKQSVSLGRQCYKKGVIAHELMHTLGFYHEHNRADRDQYVTIHYDNIRPGSEVKFQRHALGIVDQVGQPYDYDSIMHYQSTSYSKNFSLPSITPKMKLPDGVVLGQRDHLSDIDIKLIRKLYGCPSKICEDKRSDCEEYGENLCQGKFASWAEENCAKHCGFGDCPVPTVCEDKRSDCKEYGDNLCQGEFAPWAEKNCAKHCGVGDCQVPTVTMHNTTTPPACVDKSDCSKYSKTTCTMFPDFMKMICPQFCSFCP